MTVRVKYTEKLIPKKPIIIYRETHMKNTCKHVYEKKKKKYIDILF